ncbi:MAG TPA: tRNA epoxyqueuosine(34) reductase QueG [Xanthomonadales bacterium]|nr:tRNA epoxyqueuosine(34) reductase QueG [Xanthomonadales bacterium]
MIIATKRPSMHPPNSKTDKPLTSAVNPPGADRLRSLKLQIQEWGQELGFQQLGVADTNLSEHEKHLIRWLEDGYHGEMSYMQRHGTRRSRPDELVPGTLRVISARMDYLAPTARPAAELMEQPGKALISRYALGRDYHKIIRKRLQKLAHRIELEIGPYGYRVFTDSAPVLEKALAEKAGLGWIGKHSNLLHRSAGSWFFLGEIYTDLPLPVDQKVENHCGSCTRCLDYCPTGAIVAPYQVDARRCISYLTIELREAIPEALRPLMGNRIFGCDDCQVVCPWNRFAQFSNEDDFAPRDGLDAVELVALFYWTEEEFLRRTEGSAIRRIGYDCWLRNIAVALGNAPRHERVIGALESRRSHSSELVREHVEWALTQHASNL